MLTSLPNLLTYGRILLIPTMMTTFFIPADWARWVAFGLFVVASITDFLDGYLARVRQQHSSFGRMLDPIADKLLVATLLLMLVGQGTIAGLSILAAVVILCREILVSGLREYLGALQISVPVNLLSKWKTLIQLLAIGFLIPAPATDKLIAIKIINQDYSLFTGIGLTLLWIAALLTLYTGYDYWRSGIAYVIDEDGDS
ncbi:MAG: CDP-diacylglycerol--glycerol-3-phosphate 3-phosphatidyltransferase [Parvularculales bacterium]